MLKFYRIVYYTYHNDAEVGVKTGRALMDEAEVPPEKTIDITWENLTEIYQQYAWVFPWNIWNFKRGRIVSFFDAEIRDKNTWDIKEWKSPLNMKLTIQYKEMTPPSIDEVLKWYDGNKAIQYLKEQGLAISLTK